VFVLLPTYRTSLDEIDALLEEHRDWLDTHCSTGRFLLVGRRVPRDGGFILAADGDRGELEKIAATDPFSTAGLVTYEVLEVLPTGGAPAVLQALAAHGVAVSVPVRNR
jgi:uncharacterized protein YciI